MSRLVIERGMERVEHVLFPGPYAKENNKFVHSSFGSIGGRGKKKKRKKKKKERLTTHAIVLNLHSHAKCTKTHEDRSLYPIAMLIESVN